MATGHVIGVIQLINKKKDAAKMLLGKEDVDEWVIPFDARSEELLGMVAAVEAAGGGAEHAVMAGIMTGDTADDGALDAALGVGGRCRGQNKCGGG